MSQLKEFVLFGLFLWLALIALVAFIYPLDTFLPPALVDFVPPFLAGQSLLEYGTKHTEPILLVIPIVTLIYIAWRLVR